MTFPATLIYNDTDFRKQFPYFADVTFYPAVTLQQFFTDGTTYVSDRNSGYLRDNSRQRALYLMTAHLAQLNDQINANNGAAPGLAIEARIDKVEVKLQPPPEKTQFQWWLNLTPWGAALAALLSVKSVGGWSIGGRPEAGAFRRPYARAGGCC